MTIVVALLAMMLAAASPAFAHTLATDEGDGVRSVAVAQDISGALGDVDRSQFGPPAFCCPTSWAHVLVLEDRWPSGNAISPLRKTWPLATGRTTVCEPRPLRCASP
jgi:hypothetical protein